MINKKGKGFVLNPLLGKVKTFSAKVKKVDGHFFSKKFACTFVGIMKDNNRN